MAAFSTNYETFRSGTPRRPGVGNTSPSFTTHSDESATAAWSTEVDIIRSGTPRRPGIHAHRRTGVRRITSQSPATHSALGEDSSTDYNAWSTEVDIFQSGTPRRPGIHGPPIVTKSRWLRNCVLPYLAGQTYSGSHTLSNGSQISVRLSVSDDCESYELQVADATQNQRTCGKIIPPPAARYAQVTTGLPDLCLRLDSTERSHSVTTRCEGSNTGNRQRSLQRSNTMSSTGVPTNGAELTAAIMDSQFQGSTYGLPDRKRLGVTIQNHAGCLLRVGNCLLKREVRLHTMSRL